MGFKIEGLKTEGLATQQVYEILQADFAKTHAGLSEENRILDDKRQAIDKRSEDLCKGVVTPIPTRDALETEYQDCHNFYMKYQKALEDRAITVSLLTSDLQRGIDYMEPCRVRDVATMESFSRINKTLYTQMLREHETCMRQLQTMHEWKAQVTTQLKDLNANLIKLGNSLTFFRPIVRNGGQPTSYLTSAKAWGKSWFAQPAPIVIAKPANKNASLSAMSIQAAGSSTLSSSSSSSAATAQQSVQEPVTSLVSASQSPSASFTEAAVAQSSLQGSATCPVSSSHSSPASFAEAVPSPTPTTGSATSLSSRASTSLEMQESGSTTVLRVSVQITPSPKASAGDVALSPTDVNAEELLTRTSASISGLTIGPSSRADNPLTSISSVTVTSSTEGSSSSTTSISVNADEASPLRSDRKIFSAPRRRRSFAAVVGEAPAKASGRKEREKKK